jgi:site-specific DNA-methyltransferase (adenine-specific)
LPARCPPVEVRLGDCLDILTTLPDASVDAVVTDPPYHLTAGKKGGTGLASLNLNSPAGRSRIGTGGFMGCAWDGGDIAFRPETWTAVARTMKPGAYLAAFASTRGYHRMACAVEDAGFIIHPMLGWLFATGFPKATRVQAKGWEGWRYGLQTLKPALEPILLAQVPFREKTGTVNVLAHGTGALNIDATRVPADWDNDPSKRGLGYGFNKAGDQTPAAFANSEARTTFDTTKGRWPPNLLHDGSPEVLAAFKRFGEKASGALSAKVQRGKFGGNGIYGSADGSGEGRDYSPSSGSAARFFPALGYGEDELRFHYSGKASRRERGGSTHPTMKPIALCAWLCRLVTPPSGTVLDPFAGSGTTGLAAMREGFRAILIEREAEYVGIIRARLAAECADVTLPLFAETA